MYSIDLSDKKALVFGVANQRSIAWAICQSLHQAGVRLGVVYQNERLRSRAERLVKDMEDVLLLQCDVTSEEEIETTFRRAGEEFGSVDYLIHSIAFAHRDDLGGDFSKLSRKGFQDALEISAYSLIPLVRHAAGLMTNGGSVVAMTFNASERVYPGYNVMGVAKAALENEVRQLAAEYGPRNIRVNAISAGPLETLAAGNPGVPGYAPHSLREGAPSTKHHPPGGGGHGLIPVQPSLQRRHRRRHPRRRRLSRNGGLVGPNSRCSTTFMVRDLPPVMRDNGIPNATLP